MKKELKFVAFLSGLLLTVLVISPFKSSATCIECAGGSTAECYRVVSGGETHIYHGKKQSCEQL